jgi:penicillin-binding protein 1C
MASALIDADLSCSVLRLDLPHSTMTRCKIWCRRIVLVTAGLFVGCYLAFCCIWYAYPFPIEQFDREPASPLVTDRHGQRLLSLVNSDGQWRQPVPLSEISPWLIAATLAAEDARFRQHRGVDYQAMSRAMAQNVAHRSVVSGASTLTMQICRQLERKPRTVSAKLWQVFRAWQLEKLRSKDQILAAYLNLAPYGGNIQGAEAAARWFFDKSAKDLSLGEAALLAGLPQSPNRFRPDRHLDEARTRRQFVLRRMTELGYISAEQAENAAVEPLPRIKSRPVPAAPHAAWHALSRRPQGGRTTIDLTRQKRVEATISDVLPSLPKGADVAVCVIEIESGDIVAWVGSADPHDPHDGQVDGVLALRSPGSALKPFLFAAAFQTRRLGPESVIYDGAIERAGWTPENFDHTFAGDLPVAEALRRSLNVPAILVTEQAGLPRCLGTLRSAGIELPANAEERGGLALAAGGIEVSLLDLVTGYATLGRSGKHRRSRLFLDETTEDSHGLDASTCGVVNDILSIRYRRPNGWENLAENQVPWCMWKTGTSSGRRDAWAVGHNEKFAIGVWAGRFSGTGHVEFVGREMAEPVLAKLFAAPEFRQDQRPSPVPRWTVERPFQFPKPGSGPLRITSPSRGDVFLSQVGPVVIHPVTNRPEGIRWFLNGRLLVDNGRPRLELNPGRYELRCVDQQGQSNAVEFAVQGIVR